MTRPLIVGLKLEIMRVDRQVKCMARSRQIADVLFWRCHSQVSR